MKFKAFFMVGVVLFAGTLTACGSNINAGNYTTNQVGQAVQTAKGKIINATPVNVSGSSGATAGVGTLAGVLAGGVAGSAIGGGTRANILGGLGGAVVGGALGNVAEQKLTQQTGMQYTIKLKNGNIVTITQGMNPVLMVGQSVLVIFGNPARVVAG